jgi:DNA-binding response OmpR family regulator
MALRPVPVRSPEYLDPVALNALRGHGIDSLVITDVRDLDAISSDGVPSIALLPVEAFSGDELSDCVGRCSQLKLPVVALVSDHDVESLDTALDVDDFLVGPPSIAELLVRCRRVLNRIESHDGPEVIRVGDLVINPANYEVSVKGRRVNLRFKEYELLLLMATSPGRVYTRETILNRVWGYDYLGGTRTVDVHIRRLRSKVEDADQRFIETVWNLGYRFKEIDRKS